MVLTVSRRQKHWCVCVRHFKWPSTECWGWKRTRHELCFLQHAWERRQVETLRNDSWRRRETSCQHTHTVSHNTNWTRPNTPPLHTATMLAAAQQTVSSYRKLQLYILIVNRIPVYLNPKIVLYITTAWLQNGVGLSIITRSKYLLL